MMPLLGLLALATVLPAADGGLLKGLVAVEALAPAAAELAQALAKGGVAMELDAGALPLRGPDGAWRARALAAALAHAGALSAVAGPPQAGQVRVEGLPRILLLENSSTVAPWSAALKRWAWPHQSGGPQEVEAAPAAWLDPGRFDLVVFGSPGWWDDFANPPGGPSRMKPGTAAAAAAYVAAGGAAVFIDVAQWDLEKSWPKSVRLASLGPFQVSKLQAAPDGQEGGLALAAVGVAADKLLRPGMEALIQHPKFEFPDGDVRAVHAAYAFPQGRGWVLGLAFHPFEQDDSLALRAQRLALNALLVAGARRVWAAGEPAPAPASLTKKPSPAPSPAPEADTATATATALPTPLPATPTRSATALPTPRPSPPPPSAIPTALPTALPTRAPTARPTPRPSPAVPMPLPTRLPTPAPTATRPAPSPVPPPTIRPQPPATPLPLPTLPAPRLVPSPRPSPQALASPAPTVRPLATATAWPTRTPRPTPPPATPVTVATAGAMPKAGRLNALGCLSSSPEPFAEGGTYVYFCLKTAAGLRLSVFDSAGTLVWRGEEAWFDAGQGQVYFEGQDSRGRPLAPGSYLYQLEARYGPAGRLGTESRQGALTRARSRARR